MRAMPRFPAISPTSATLSDRVYSVLAQKARERPGPVYPLHVGDTYREPLLAARAESQRSADVPRLHGYSPVQGEPTLLDAIIDDVRARTGVALDREALQVVAGATSGFAVASVSLLDPGDEVLVLAPFWPLIRGIIASRGAVPVEVPFWTRLGEPGFDPAAAIEAAITGRTVAIYLNSPNNPTGVVLPEAVADAIARAARAHDLWVLSDEAYDALQYGERAAPIWAREDLRDRTIAAHTLSKSYGLAGARVGWVHGPAEAMASIRGVQAFQVYCASRPMQLGAVRALREGAAWIEEARELYAEAAKKAAAVVGIPAPVAGTFLFFDASPYLAEGEPLMAFLERCLDAGVLLTPGAASGRHYERWVRLCFTAVPPADLDDALARLAPVLKRRA
jgi:N-succinyldiaminopimelate aminotransferase